MAAIFNRQQAAELAKKVEADYKTLFPGNNQLQVVQIARQAWEKLANEMKAEFAGLNCTPDQCKNKYLNMKKQAKSAFASANRSRKKTGGGEEEEEPNDAAYNAIVNTFKDDASFIGTPGGKSTALFGGTSSAAGGEQMQLGGTSSASFEEMEKKAGFGGNILATTPETERKPPIFQPPFKRRPPPLSPAIIGGGGSLEEAHKKLLDKEYQNQCLLGPILEKFDLVLDKAGKFYSLQMGEKWEVPQAASKKSGPPSVGGNLASSLVKWEGPQGASSSASSSVPQVNLASFVSGNEPAYGGQVIDPELMDEEEMRIIKEGDDAKTYAQMKRM